MVKYNECPSRRAEGYNDFRSDRWRKGQTIVLKGHHVSIAKGNPSRGHRIRFVLLCLVLPILGSVTACAGRAQTAAPVATRDCKLNELDCGQDILRNGSSVKTGKTDQPDSKGSPPIQDNSFLVEEAYNQEFGVVQHIHNFQRHWNSKDWIYTFTQEWPVDARPRHQLSYTLAALHSGDPLASGAGFGDVFLNYRYQLLGNGRAKVAFAPRVSVLLPTGDHHLGRGTGGTGIQALLPLSVVLTRKLVTHWNAGTTIIPNSRHTAGETGTTFGYNFGQSLVWLAYPRFNVLLETVFNRSQQVTAPKTTQWTSDLLLNPGIRWAYNFKNGLQIVPGVAVPIGVGPSSGEKGVFIYLSLEHPYRKLPEE
jgi:hypothetical protein